MSVSWILVGVLWLLWGWRTLSHMQDVEVWHYLHMIVMMDLLFNLFILKVDAWRVVKTKENEKKTQNKDTFKYFYCI